MDVLFPGSVPGQLSPKYDRHLPRAPSPAQGVTPCGMTSWVTWEGITLPSSLLRAHAPDQNPLSASVFPCTKSLRRLWRIPSGSWPFPALSLRILLHVSGPLPRLLLWCAYPFLPTELRPSQQSNPVGTQHNPYYSNFSMGEFREVEQRPLSAQLLEPTKAERECKVDRSQLLSIQGRGRKEQMQLAADFGITNYAPPAGGCLLTDPMFTRRLRDLFSHQEDYDIHDLDLLKYGRHFRADDQGKIIVGRNNLDNEKLRGLSTDDDLVLFMADFPGPHVVVPHGNEALLPLAASLCVRYSDAPADLEANVICQHKNSSRTIKAKAAAKEDCERWII